MHRQEQFLLGWEVDLNGDEDCSSFISTQITHKKVALNSDCYTQLIFEDNLLIKATSYFDGIADTAEWRKEKLNQGIGILQYKAYSINPLIELKIDKEGSHSLGGEFSNGFLVPNNNLKGSLQRIGLISCSDPNFSWLPFDLELLFPIYYFQAPCILMDYSNPKSPIIINESDLDDFESDIESLTTDSRIMFLEQKMISEDVDKNSLSAIATGGLPSWLQYPDIPRCPKTNNTMKFVCQMDEYTNFKIGKTNVVPLYEAEEKYFKETDIHSGTIYIFFEPSSNIVCYLTQST